MRVLKNKGFLLHFESEKEREREDFPSVSIAHGEEYTPRPRVCACCNTKMYSYRRRFNYYCRSCDDLNAKEIRPRDTLNSKKSIDTKELYKNAREETGYHYRREV